MKRIILPLLFCVLTNLLSLAQSGIVNTTRKQVNRFFGIHMDFHANAHSNQVGKTLTKAVVDSMLSMVKPDFLQVDCKGHPGYSSYPTKVGTPAPGIIKDPLRIFREVTAKHNIPLYVHYSGIQDRRAIQLHAGWGNINAEGERDKSNTSLFSPYVDSLMIPQLKELITKYNIDGAWIDGDSWAVQAAYRPEAVAEFKKETGISTVPRTPKDSGYYEFMNFNRKKFRQYLAHYVNTIHKFEPDFLITSNWAYSSMMPEKVDVNLDFLSGDLATRSYVSDAAFEARCLAPQGKPWDLMSWGFTHNWDNNIGSYKSAIQLEQEAAHALSMGGGFQIYYPQNRDASIKPWKINTMAKVAKFCRARQAYTEGALAVPQIALLHSTEGFKRVVNGLYNNFDGIFESEQGILEALLDGQNTVEVLMEHSLKGRMKDYKLIVIPEWKYLAPSFVDKLKDYMTEGGNLMVIGAEAVKIFENNLGVRFGAYAENKKLNLGYKNDMATVMGSYQQVTLKEGTQSFGRLYSKQDLRFPSGVPATIQKFGKGKIAAVYMNFGSNYRRRKAPVMRAFLSGLVNELFPDPLLEVIGSHLVNVTLNKLGGDYAINLINMAGPHANKSVYVYEEVPKIGPLNLSLTLDEKPKQVMLQPADKPLNFTFNKGKARITVPEVALHSIIVVKP